jgi:acetylornithine/succinyldiaminopimelate/putrescine aminotransferase
MTTTFPTAPNQRYLASIGHDFREGKREGAYLWSEEGARYLDCVSGGGIYNLGRRVPELADALREAMHAADQGNFPMISIEKAALAEALGDFAGHGLDCAMFSVMRGETVEGACKIARGVTGRPGLVSAEGAWHGETGFAMSLSQRADAADYGPLIPETHRMPWGDIDAARAAISNTTAAVIIEPVQAENGCRVAAHEYLRGLQQICHQRGALFLIDETQTNFGRTGAPFAFAAAGLKPDMLLLGEALGGGMFPIAATLVNARVRAWLDKHPLIHLSTFGGSDVGCRVALRALELYAEHTPWENAAHIGAHLQSALNATGQGLLLAVQCESPEAAIAMCRQCAERGVLVLPGEVAKDTVVIRPPLTITEDDAGEILRAFA